MSAIEHYARTEALEQNPELLRKIENARKEIGGNADTAEQAETEAQSESISEASELNEWPEPEPLGGELPPVPAFDTQLLPFAFRPLVEDTAERMQVPLDFPAVVSVLCLAGVTNRRATIQPKAVDMSAVTRVHKPNIEKTVEQC
jgi:hypothetical protein